MSVVADPGSERDEPAARPSLRDRVDRFRLTARRQQWGRLAFVALLAFLVGISVGRAAAPRHDLEARAAIETSVVPIALDADAIWTAATDERPAVGEGLVAVRWEGDAQLVLEHLGAWLEAYDQSLVRLAGVNLPSTARPVQRQFITAVSLSRDAVEVLGQAATVDDETARRDLTTEVGRLRSRSEQLMQTARASTTDLAGRPTDVSPLPPVRSFLDGRGD